MFELVFAAIVGALSSAVGPAPCLTTPMGISTEPQGASLRL
jgi:hypothetical protein